MKRNCMEVIEEFIDYVIKNHRKEFALIIDENSRINLTIQDKELNRKLNRTLSEKLKQCKEK